jgi:hypothetical protein
LRGLLNVAVVVVLLLPVGPVRFCLRLKRDRAARAIGVEGRRVQADGGVNVRFAVLSEIHLDIAFGRHPRVVTLLALIGRVVVVLTIRAAVVRFLRVASIRRLLFQRVVVLLPLIVMWRGWAGLVVVLSKGALLEVALAPVLVLVLIVLRIVGMLLLIASSCSLLVNLKRILIKSISCVDPPDIAQHRIG